jgi:flagellar biosynthesis/type III secretory pathway protein FliH
MKNILFGWYKNRLNHYMELAENRAVELKQISEELEEIKTDMFFNYMLKDQHEDEVKYLKNTIDKNNSDIESYKNSRVEITNDAYVNGYQDGFKHGYNKNI